ncbi:uncharacterized protein LOC122709176 [Cervus elaphus]|uniref:uncharacterized protein LOC122709176 n=1 Tax=Cervus elaphus TaxID=9860 RepID=UPI001CC2D420|nr:uncharacterized protein LOC122709176 [Cervus elaphus]
MRIQHDCWHLRSVTLHLTKSVFRVREDHGGLSFNLRSPSFKTLGRKRPRSHRVKAALGPRRGGRWCEGSPDGGGGQQRGQCRGPGGRDPGPRLIPGAPRAGQCPPPSRILRGDDTRDGETGRREPVPPSDSDAGPETPGPFVAPPRHVVRVPGRRARAATGSARSQSAAISRCARPGRRRRPRVCVRVALAAPLSWGPGALLPATGLSLMHNLGTRSATGLLRDEQRGRGRVCFQNAQTLLQSGLTGRELRKRGKTTCSLRPLVPGLQRRCGRTQAPPGPGEGPLHADGGEASLTFPARAGQPARCQFYFIHQTTGSMRTGAVLTAFVYGK